MATVHPNIVSVFTWVRANTNLKTDREIIDSLTRFAAEDLADYILEMKRYEVVELMLEGTKTVTFIDFVDYLENLLEAHANEHEAGLELEEELSEWFHLDDK